MIKIYKNTIQEEDRLRVLEMVQNLPEMAYNQSVCTDEEVNQLKDWMPLFAMGKLWVMHAKMRSIIQDDFGLTQKGIELVPPQYNDPRATMFITVDRRLPGMSLGKHRDIPTGTFKRHIGAEDGQSRITMSAIYYWNDDFEGGELLFSDTSLPQEKTSSSPNFLHYPYLYKPVAGDLVVFPSNLEHQILTINSGIRYTTQHFYDRTVL
jgi:hypothetical protein